MLRKSAALYVLSAAQYAFSFLSLAIIARRFSVAEFGGYSYLLATYDLLTIFSSFGLHNYIIRQVAIGHDASDLLLTTWTFMLVNFLLIVPVTWIIMQSDPLMVQHGVWLFFPLTISRLVSVLSGSMANVLTGQLKVVQAYALNALSVALNAILLVVFLIAEVSINVVSVSWLAMLIGCTAFLVIMAVTRRSSAFRFKRSALGPRSAYLNVLQKGLPFFLTSAAGVVIARGSYTLVNSLSTTTDLGYFGLIDKLLIPLNLAVTALIQVVYPVVSKEFVEAPAFINAIVQRLARYLIAAFVWICVLATLFAGYVVPWLFGTKYTEAVPSFNLYVWKFALYPVLCLAGLLMNATHRERLLQTLSWVAVPYTFVLLAVFGYAWGVRGIAFGYLAASLIDLVLVSWMMKDSWPTTQIVRLYGKTLGAALITYGSIYLVDVFWLRIPLVVIATLGYGLVLRRFRVVDEQDVAMGKEKLWGVKRLLSRRIGVGRMNGSSQ